MTEDTDKVVKIHTAMFGNGKPENSVMSRLANVETGLTEVRDALKFWAKTFIGAAATIVVAVIIHGALT